MSTLARRAPLCVAALAGALAACSGGGGTVDKTVPFVAWSDADHPELFGEPLVYRLDQLPSQGDVNRRPWPGSYWPTASDSINYRWAGAGTESPAAKYGRAFGVTGAEQAVSQHFGLLSASERRSCWSDYSCDRQQGEVCARRAGQSVGRCIPGWWGICHGWAAAAVLEPEPVAPTTVNGVTFEVNDIKALASLVYDRPSYELVSLRCNADGQRGQLRHDAFGRPTGADAACRDTNPGTFHVLVANLIGRMKRAFVEDRVYDLQVWNQPVVGYKVLTQREVSAQRANQLVGASGSEYIFNDRAVRWYELELELRWVDEVAATPATNRPLAGQPTLGAGVDRYRYLLELDQAGAIIGGEWLGESKQAHPDFLWLPLGPSEVTVAGGAIRYEDVKRLITEAAGAGSSAPPSPPATTSPPTAAIQHLDLTDSVAQGAAKYYVVDVRRQQPIVVRTTSTTDIDIYLRLGHRPEGHDFDGKGDSYSGNETVSLTPDRDEVLHIMVYGFEAGTYRLTTTGQ